MAKTATPARFKGKMEESKFRYGKELLAAAVKRGGDIEKVRKSLIDDIKGSGDKFEPDEKTALIKQVEDYFHQAKKWQRKEWLGDLRLAESPEGPTRIGETDTGEILFSREVGTWHKKEYERIYTASVRFRRKWDQLLYGLFLSPSEFFSDKARGKFVRFDYDEKERITLRMKINKDNGMTIRGSVMGPDEIKAIVKTYIERCKEEPGVWREPHIKGFSTEVRLLLAREFMRAGFTLRDANGTPTVEDADLSKYTEKESGKWKWYTGDKKPQEVDISRILTDPKDPAKKQAYSIHEYIIRRGKSIVAPVPTSSVSRPKEETPEQKQKKRTAEVKLEEERKRASLVTGPGSRSN